MPLPCRPFSPFFLLKGRTSKGSWLKGLSLAAFLACTPAGAQAEKVKLPDDSLVAGIPGKGELTVKEIEAFLAKPENQRAKGH